MKYLIIILLTVGCATTANYEKLLRSWVGRPVSELEAAWGFPTNTSKLANGNLVYVYEWNGGSHTNYQTWNDGSVTAQTKQRWCITSFELDNKNIVTRWSWRGNRCRA